MELPITTILASLSAIWLFVLSGHVIQQRRSAGVSLGAGDDPVLLRRTRAQANLTEYAPIFILMIGLSELQHGNAYVIATIASLFMIARLAHGYALSFSENSPRARFLGTVFTFIPLTAIALYNLFIVVA